MTANILLHTELFALRDRLKTESRSSTGKAQRICTDEAIREMILSAPQCISDFSSIQGLGRTFMENYAETFLRVIKEHERCDDDYESIACALQEMEKRLVNIGKGNRLLYLRGVNNQKEMFDLAKTDGAFKTFSSVLDGKRVTIASKGEDDYRRLSSLYRNNMNVFREKGRNDLYIAFPFAWGIIPGGDLEIKAPLALFPVELVRNAETIDLVFDGSREPVFNTDLILAYFKVNGISRALPEGTVDSTGDLMGSVLSFYEDAGIHLAHSNDDVITEFDRGTPEGNLRVAKHMILGRFPAYSCAVQKDFMDIQSERLSSKLLKHFINPPEDLSVSKSDVTESSISPISELNAAQEEAVCATEDTDILVVQGPPGTGKSQTITNMVAGLASQGKRVLLVSEKKAALDVVRSRLGRLSAYTVSVDDPTDRNAFYGQIERLVSSSDNEVVQPRDPSVISGEIQERFDRLESIEKRVYRSSKRGAEPYAFFIDHPLHDDKEEKKLDRRLEKIFKQGVLDGDLESLMTTHERFSRRSFLTDLDDCMEMRSQHPWMMDLKPDLTELDAEAAECDLKSLKREIDAWRTSGFFSKMLSKTTLKARIESVMGRYWNYYRCTDPAITGNEIEDYIIGMRYYDDFATLNNMYESLPESGKIYYGMMKRAAENEICAPYLINDVLFDYTAIEQLKRFESENRDVMEYIASFDSIIDEIDALMQEKRESDIATAESVLSNYAKKMQLGCMYPEMRRVLGMKRRWSINKFVKTFWNELYDGVRIWIMTPDAVSEILPLKPGMFDMVVFDEASQMFAEKGIPSLLRSKKAVIAGDHMQLRPTKLGAGRIGQDEDYAEEGLPLFDSDSLLDLARRKYPSVLLRYHYRSESQELISFSNSAFYNNRLLVSPNLHPDGKPIEFIRIDDGFWSDRCNRPEAERVVDLVADILLNRKNSETIGVITFNSSQMDLIERLLDERCSSDSVFGKLYCEETKRKENGEDAGLFVRNIENVQGDERDIIVFSVGYAKGPEGKLVRNFGWLNQSGGENRLNVAITRAKKKVYVVSSFDPEELDVSDMKNKGPVLLRRYLEYCRAVSSGDIDAQNDILRSLSSAKDERPRETDCRFRDRIFESLKAKGIDVVKDLRVGDYSVDVAVRVNGAYVLGIECDGPLYNSHMSLRERDWHRRRYLESKGWKMVRAWSPLWWSNPERETEKIVASL